MVRKRKKKCLGGSCWVFLLAGGKVLEACTFQRSQLKSRSKYLATVIAISCLQSVCCAFSLCINCTHSIRNVLSRGVCALSWAELCSLSHQQNALCRVSVTCPDSAAGFRSFGLMGFSRVFLVCFVLVWLLLPLCWFFCFCFSWLFGLVLWFFFSFSCDTDFYICNYLQKVTGNLVPNFSFVSCYDRDFLDGFAVGISLFKGL